MQYAIEKHDSDDDVMEKDEHSETLLDHLVKLTTGSLYILSTWHSEKLTPFTTDRNVLKDELLNILIAGRDTVSIPHVP